MAKIAEMAEKKNMQPKVNTVLKEVTSMVQKKAPSQEATASQAVSTSVAINAVDAGSEKNRIPNESTAREVAEGRRRKQKEGIGSTC